MTDFNGIVFNFKLRPRLRAKSNSVASLWKERNGEHIERTAA